MNKKLCVYSFSGLCLAIGAWQIVSGYSLVLTSGAVMAAVASVGFAYASWKENR